MERLLIGSALLLGVSCFDGSGALGLPCRTDDQCGNGQRCIEEVCGGPQGSSGAGSGTGSGTVSGTGTETGTGKGSDASSSESSGTETTGGGPNPDLPGCAPGVQPVDGGPPVERALSVTDSGNPMAVVVGRFSNALDPAVAVLSRTPAQVTVFAFNGASSSRELSLEVVDEPMDFAVGDLDGDGYDDLAIVTANTSLPDLSVYWGAATAPFDVEERTTVEEGLDSAFSVAIGDIVGDGDVGVVVSTGGQGRAAALFTVEGRVLTLAGLHAGISDSPWDTTIVELDGEAPAEILIAGANDGGLDGIPGSDRVHVLSAKSGVLSSLRVLDPEVVTPFGVGGGDLDGDGVAEILVVGKNVDLQTRTPEQSDNPGQIGLCSRPSNDQDFGCTTWEPGPLERGFSNVRLADLDCDGVLDVVIGTSGGTEPTDGAVVFSTGPLTSGFDLGQSVMTGSVGNRLAIADVTEDGRPDVLVPIYGVEGAGSSSVRVFSFEPGAE